MTLHGISMDRYLHERYFEKDNKDLGKVHSVFQRVINVETGKGDIFSLSHPRDAYMPFMIQVRERNDFLMEEHLEGKKVCFQNGRLSIGSLEISLDGIKIKERIQSKYKITESLSESLEIAKGILQRYGKRGGCLGYYGQYEDMDLMEKELAKRIGSLETEMDFGRLIGFGRGLTPSGDDFSVGLLCAARYIDFKHTEKETVIEKITEELKNTIRLSEGDTTDVSRQMLKLSLDEEFPGPLMDLCESIITGESAASCRDSMLKLLNIGSTSGTDMATGVIYALEKAEEERNYGGKYV